MLFYVHWLRSVFLAALRLLYSLGFRVALAISLGLQYGLGYAGLESLETLTSFVVQASAKDPAAS